MSALLRQTFTHARSVLLRVYFELLNAHFLRIFRTIPFRYKYCATVVVVQHNLLNIYQ